MKNGSTLFNNRLNFAISVLFILCMTAIAFIFDTTAGIISLFLFLAYVIYMVLYIVLENRSSMNENTKKTIAAHTFDYLEKLTSPALLISGDNRVSWFNKAYSDVYPDITIRFDDKCSDIDNGFISVERIEEASENRELFNNVIKNGRYYDIKFYRIDAGNNHYILVVWNDITELHQVMAELTAANVLVGYIVVDNISELSQGMQDKYREVSAHISTTLTEWAQSMNGIVKEYERDKYIIFFEERYLNEQMANKFDILDKISELSPDDAGSIPMTVSIGISQIKGSLADKEIAAKSALQLALQRGGAQVVVKTENDNEIFGGKTKTVQKVTKIKARIISAKLVSAIKASSNILVMAHQNPDFDAVAASVGVARLSSFLGKRVNIIIDLKNTSFLASKAMLQNIHEYDNVFVDAVYGQDLLTPDTLLVIVDASNPLVFESPEIYKNSLRTIIIDHHRQAMQFPVEPMIAYVEPTSSSASELMSEILEYALPSMTLYKEESELLMAGIFLDTQNFTRNVGIRTFSAAVYLRSEGGNPGKAQALFKSELSEFKKMAEFERNIMIFRSIFAISQFELDNDEENRVVAARAADRMLQIDGIRASFALTLVGETIHISARSDASVNVGLILEKMGGGGHYDSAGARIVGSTVKQTLIALREAIVDYCEKP